MKIIDNHSLGFYCCLYFKIFLRPDQPDLHRLINYTIIYYKAAIGYRPGVGASGTSVPMGTRVPAGTHRNFENLGTAGYRVPGKFEKLGTAGYRVPSKFWKLGTGKI